MIACLRYCGSCLAPSPSFPFRRPGRFPFSRSPGCRSLCFPTTGIPHVVELELSLSLFFLTSLLSCSLPYYSTYRFYLNLAIQSNPQTGRSGTTQLTNRHSSCNPKTGRTQHTRAQPIASPLQHSCACVTRRPALRPCTCRWRLRPFAVGGQAREPASSRLGWAACLKLVPPRRSDLQ